MTTDKPAETASTLRSAADSMAESWARAQRRKSGAENPVPLPWTRLGDALSGGRGGIWPGLHVLVSNTGVGKTQFGIQAALHAADNNVPALYCALEMSTYNVHMRLASIRQGIPWNELDNGTADALHGDPPRLPAHLYIDAGSAYDWPASRMKALARAVRAKHPDGPMLVVLDYLQVVGAERNDPRADLRVRIGQAAYTGRMLATEMNAAVLLISSTARSNYDAIAGKAEEKGNRFGEGDPARFIGLGKESGEIEYGADSVLVMGKAFGLDNLPVKGEGWIGLAKVRAPHMKDGARTEWVRICTGWQITEHEPTKHAWPEDASKKVLEGTGRPPERFSHAK